MNNMFIEPIQPMRFGDGMESVQKVNGRTGETIFKGVFLNAINDVRSTEENLVNEQYLLATGQLEDPHSVSIAASKAQLSVDLLVNLRNKALDSYNEIMRMGI